MRQRFVNIIFVCLSFTAIGFSLWKVTPFTVSEGTFIGLIVSLLSTVVTFSIGYQILNVIELRKEIKKAHDDNEALQNENLILGDELKVLKKEMVEAQKMQESKEQVNYFMLSSLIEFNSGQKIQTCLTAFSYMHKALLCSLNIGGQNDEWIFKWMRTFIADICKQSFPFNLLSTDENGIIYVSLMGQQNRLLYSEAIDNYCSNIYETDIEIKNNHNFERIRFEYNRVMNLFRKRIGQVKNEPNKLISDQDKIELLNY